MKVLLLGGTGAMGGHLARILAARGDEVVVTSRRKRGGFDGIRYIEGNALSHEFLEHALSGGYDSVVDFMVRPSVGFRETANLVMSNAGQYVFVSSYRVYADSPVLTEGSPRLLDVSDDAEYLATDEYALAKARSEDALRESEFSNWTIVRPGITFDGSGRFQLGTLEAGTWLLRAMNGIPVMFPDEMLSKVTTLSWGGDVARMIASVVGNPDALGEDYIVASSEYLTWAEIAEVYREETGLELVACTVEEYEYVVGGRYQIWLDRMVDRRIDNAKIMAICGMGHEEIMPVKERLSTELSAFLLSGHRVHGNTPVNARMDGALGGFRSLRPLLRSRFGVATLKSYVIRRFVLTDWLLRLHGR